MDSRFQFYLQILNRVYKLSVAEVEHQKEQIRQNWPQLVSKSLKEKIIRLFQKETSTATLSTFTCALCAEECLHSSGCNDVQPADIDLNLL